MGLLLLGVILLLPKLRFGVRVGYDPEPTFSLRSLWGAIEGTADGTIRSYRILFIKKVPAEEIVEEVEFEYERPRKEDVSEDEAEEEVDETIENDFEDEITDEKPDTPTQSEPAPESTQKSKAGKAKSNRFKLNFKRKSKRPKKVNDEKPLSSFKFYWGMFKRERGLIGEIIKKLGRNTWRVIRSFHVERFSLQADIASSDPALTGAAFGIAQSVVYLPMPRAVDLDVSCNFLREKTYVSFDGIIAVRPLTLVWRTAGIILFLPWKRIGKSGWKSWREWRAFKKSLEAFDADR